MRMLTTIVILLCVSACASEGPPAAASSAADMPVTASAEAEAASADATMASEDQLDFVDIPPVEADETIPVAEQSNKNERVCRREMRTGTHRAVRVCRTRAEMDRLEQEGKDTFKDLHRDQSISREY